MQVDTPFAQGAGQLGAVRIHRGVIVVVIGQLKVINLVGELIYLKDDTIVIDLRNRGQAGDIFRNSAASVDEARIVHVRQACVGAFQQRGGGGDILIAPELAPGQFHQKIGL